MEQMLMFSEAVLSVSLRQINRNTRWVASIKY